MSLTSTLERSGPGVDRVPDAEENAEDEDYMTENPHHQLSRRERQIMDVLYQLGRATAADVLEGLPNPPGYSAVRAMLRLLEEKGFIRLEQDGQRYVFIPTVAREKARKSALKQMIQTFFDGSATDAVAALLDMSRAKLTKDELDSLSKMIEEARKKGQ
jgi:BlaI family penicillinase repressor